MQLRELPCSLVSACVDLGEKNIENKGENRNSIDNSDQAHFVMSSINWLLHIRLRTSTLVWWQMKRYKDIQVMLPSLVH